MAFAWGRGSGVGPAFAGNAARRWASHARDAVTGYLDEEAGRGRFFLWSPVAIASGILIYFALPTEPGMIAPGILFGIAVAAAFGLRRSAIGSIALTGVALVVSGLLLAKIRTEFVSQPVLSKKHGPAWIDGTLRKVERRNKGVRLTIAITSLSGLDRAKRPALVHVTLRGKYEPPKPGDRIAARVILLPPPGPVAPGASHYGRDLFFRGIGATGFVLGRPTFSPAKEGSFFTTAQVAIERFRHTVTRRIGIALPGETGALAAALLSGERGEISEATNVALRASGLAHILSISGMHMSLFAVTLYWLVRRALAAVPGLALRRPIRAWAAVVGLAGAGFYLLLSGGGVPAERSWIMVSIMFLALIIGRRALTMRNVALAALVILAFEPESVLSASFQMSFAATVALIAAYETAAGRFLSSQPHGFILLPVRYAVGLAATSLVAGLATGVFGAFHFHTITPYGLVGNLLAMPILGLIVMPMGMLGLALMPFGLEAGPLILMGAGLDGVTGVAQMVAAWSGAVLRTQGLTAGAVLIAGFAGLWLCLWRASWRLAGLGLLPLVSLAGSPQLPDLFVEGDGKTIAVRGEAGRLLVAGLRSGRFSAARWLEADADPRSLSDPTLKKGFLCDDQACHAQLGAGGMVALVLVSEALERWCREASVLVTPKIAPPDCAARTVIDGAALARSGAHTVRMEDGIPEIRTALAPGRPWDRRAVETADAQRGRPLDESRSRRSEPRETDSDQTNDDDPTDD